VVLRRPGERRDPGLADELAHHPEPAGRGDGACLRLDVPGDQPDQRGLARAVRPHQRRRDPLAYPEAHVVEQRRLAALPAGGALVLPIDL